LAIGQAEDMVFGGEDEGEFVGGVGVEVVFVGEAVVESLCRLRRSRRRGLL
jgi:hypothetical protein